MPSTGRIPVGIVLDGRFEVGEFLETGNHADVYAVKDLETEDHSVKLEGRLYNPNEESKKYKEYKLRSIRRLRKRIVTETKWNGAKVIIYRTDGLPTDEVEPLVIAETEGNEGTPPTSEHILSAINGSLPRDQSEYRRESARLRQLDRRARKRERKRQLAAQPASAVQGPPDLKVEYDDGIDDEMMNSFVALLAVHNQQSDRLKQLRPLERRVAEEHHRWQGEKVTFETENEIEEFVEFKAADLVFLRRLLKKVPAAVSSCNNILEKLLGERAQFKKKSKRWEKLHHGPIREVRGRLDVLKSMSDILPQMLSTAEALYRPLKRKANAIRAAREKQEQDSTSAELAKRIEELARQVKRYENWAARVFPGSGSYVEIKARRDAAFTDLIDQMSKRKISTYR